MTLARSAVLIGVALVVALAVYLFLFRSSGHEYTLIFENAGQLVKGDNVQVGGRAVGTVKGIELTDDNQAAIKVSVQEPYAPLREGTQAVIRLTSLSGIANRYIALSPGPDASRTLPDQATLTTASTTTAVDLDQLFNTLTPKARADLQGVIEGFKTQLNGKGQQAGQATEYFNPLLSSARRLVNKATEDDSALTDFLVSSSRTATAIASRRDDLSSLVSNANATTGAIAAENQALSQALDLLPTTLRRGNSTFVNLRATLDDLDPLVEDSKPATKNLAPFLRELRPLVHDAKPTIADLSTLVRQPGADNDLVDATLKLPGFQQVASPALKDGTGALRKSQPVLEFVRPYIPELVGWFRDFGVGAVQLRRQRPLRAHPADLQRLPVPRPAGRPAAARPAAGGAAARRPADGDAQALPGRREPAGAGRLGALPRRRRQPRLRPEPGAGRPMIRGFIIAVVLVLIVVGVVVVAREDSKPPYQVRAIFDNAGFVIPGEDVKIAGVKVGKIDSIDVTPDFKAAVVLDITEPGYADFRKDASCIVRPQNLIGERFVECKPTQPRSATQSAPGPLAVIQNGPGKGQHLLPVDNTSQTVDIDVIGDIMREPERQRLSLILNELGTGLAGRGKDLNEVIRRANPALEETDKVLALLAAQNNVLEQLATNSDTILAPLARDRARVASAIRNSSDVAKATAEKRGALAADIQTLPAFLDELKPTMETLGAFADESTPVLTDLGARAPEINQVIERLGPFSQAAIPAVNSLGDASKVGTPAVTDARPVIADLRSLANNVRPVGKTLRQVLESFNETGGIERLMDYVYYQTQAINGFDATGHYLRAGLIVNQCSTYAVTPVAGCSANFPKASASATAASAVDAAGDDPVLRATALALARALGQQVKQREGRQEEGRQEGQAQASQGAQEDR